MVKNNFPVLHWNRHTREGGYLVHPAQDGISAFAGMTTGKLFFATF